MTENGASGKPPLDEPRLLGRSLGYTNSPAIALRFEGEAVSEDDQRAITQAAHDRAQNGRREELRAALERVERSRAHFESQMRHCERQLSRLRRRIADA